MGRKIAKVAVSRAVYAIDKPYDYWIPKELEKELVPGIWLLVPFGSGNRETDGIVLSIREEGEGGPSLKAIQSKLDDAPVLDHKGIQ